jgi:hypothetical protein
VQLFPSDVYLTVPLTGLLQQRNPAVLTRLGAVSSRFRAQRRDELRNGHSTKSIHLTGILVQWVIRLRRRTSFVDGRAIKRARRFLLGIVVAVRKRNRESGESREYDFPKKSRRGDCR